MVRENHEYNKVRKWLKENKVKAVPFDKGRGFALMSDKGYDEKINKILKRRQFKVKRLRSNSRPIEQIEQERVNKYWKALRNSKKNPKTWKASLSTWRTTTKTLWPCKKYTRKESHCVQFYQCAVLCMKGSESWYPSGWATFQKRRLIAVAKQWIICYERESIL